MTLERDRPRRKREPRKPWVIPTIVAGVLLSLGFVFALLSLSGNGLGLF
ncbi:hypothetical protein [Marisediminicola antarctica]|nr:hypothetical protein [Marisediminicola antarctica]